jgi:hypothetical protein
MADEFACTPGSKANCIQINLREKAIEDLAEDSEIAVTEAVERNNTNCSTDDVLTDWTFGKLGNQGNETIKIITKMSVAHSDHFEVEGFIIGAV